MTGPTWKAAAYPILTVCGFCGNTLTIALNGDGPTTSTSGHAHDCIQNPNRTRQQRQGSAA